MQRQSPAFTRRGFLIGSGATIGALAVGAYFGRRPFYRYMAGTVDGASAPGGLTDDHTLWFEISPDNQVTLFIPKVEMGQGIHTSMAQIGAEELEIAWNQVNVVQSGTAFGPGAGFGTGGDAGEYHGVLPQVVGSADQPVDVVVAAAEGVIDGG